MLERERLAVMLRECTQAGSARQAVQLAIESAFDQRDPAQRPLLETIQRVDLNGESTHSAATHMHLSIRHFFRYRKEAIAAIAQAMEKILRRPADSHRHLVQLAQTIQTINPKAAREIYLRVPTRRAGQVAYNIVRTALWAGIDVTQEQLDACDGPWRLLALAAVARHRIARGEDESASQMRAALRQELSGNSGALYDAVAFELAAQEILDAYRRGDVDAAGAIAETIRTLAGPNEQLLGLAMTMEAQQHLVEGDLTAAALVLTDVESLDVHSRDVNIMARTAYCNAQLSHLRGFHEDAYALANGAGPAIAALESGFGFRAASIAGRAALQAGLAWTPPDELIERYPHLWTRAETEAVIGRHLLARDPQAAHERLEAALTLARRHHSTVIGTYIEGGIAAALSLHGQPEEAQTLWLRVWESALRARDQLALYDLFAIPAAPQRDLGPLQIDGSFMAVLQNHLERAVPAYVFTKANGLDALTCGLLRNALLAAIGKAPAPAQMGGQLEQLAGAMLRLGISADQTRRVAGFTARAAAQALAPLLPPPRRQIFQKKFYAAWAAIMEPVQSAMQAGSARLRA